MPLFSERKPPSHYYLHYFFQRLNTSHTIYNNLHVGTLNVALTLSVAPDAKCRKADGKCHNQR